MPLPHWLATGPHPDGIESAKLQAMLNSELISRYCWTVDDPPSTYTIKDFFRTVVSTVSDLRTQSKLATKGGERTTVAIWLRLLFSLGTCIGDDVILLEETTFIKPRRRAGTRSMADVEGIAIFMATYGIDSEYLCRKSPSPATNAGNVAPSAPSPIARSSPSLQSSARCDVECEGLSEYRHSAPHSSMSVDQCDKSKYEYNNQRSRSSDISVSMNSEDPFRLSSAAHEDTEHRSKTRSLTTESSGESNGLRSVFLDKWVNVPLQAQMIPTRGMCSRLALPVFVVADEGTIMPLIRSMLYQRYVLGIREPAVGFIGSRTGTEFRVIIGWLNSDTMPGSDLPSAHVAFNHDPCGTPNSSLGTFDLTEPLSAFSMAQFIMQVSHHFLSALHATPVGGNYVDMLSWRNDGIDHEFYLGEQWKERVTRWARGVCDGEDSSDIEEEDIDNTPNTSKLQKHVQTPKSTSIRSAKRDQAGSKKDEGSVIKTRYSNSSFAALPNQGLSSSESTSNWLFERSAFTISCVKLGQSDDESVEIDAMIDKYQEITESVWPPEWKSLDDLPSVDSSVQSRRNKLFQNYDPHIKNFTTSFGAMDADTIAILLSRFHAILNASLGAFSRETAAATLGANESERRHDWDSLLTSVYVADLAHPETIVHGALLERTLNSARNDAADEIDEFVAKQERLAQQYAGLCFDALTFARKTFPDTSVAVQQCSAAYTDAFSQRLAVAARLDADTQKMVTQHSRLDPETARCDAILVVQCRIDTMQWLQVDLSKCRQKFDLIVHSAEGKARSNDRVGATKAQPTSGEERHLLHDPFHFTPQKAIQGDPSIRFDSLSLPILIAEYKKKDDSGIFKAVNQCRIYLVSAVRFLEALGITDQPVFGLVTKGAEGSIFMAWLNGKTEKIYIIDRNVKTFDLTNPLDAFQFATILVRLSQHAQGLKTKFEDEDYQSTLREKFKSGIPQWSKRFQNMDVKAMQNEDITRSMADVVIKN
ncbi:hypothetical protein V8B97DRAFT_1981379 [Scleroderma yunnanense]